MLLVHFCSRFTVNVLFLYIHKGWEGGIYVGGKIINILSYADHTALFASDEQELIKLLEIAEMVSPLAGFSNNKLKTKTY